jgi:hypothetical protein
MKQPAEHLRDWLDFYRSGGGRFDDVWPEAVARACRGAPVEEDWPAWFASTVDTWRRCYERAPALPWEYGVHKLAAGHEFAELPGSRRCVHCGGGMDGRAPQARYCTLSCRMDARRQRAADCTGPVSQTGTTPGEVLREQVAA